MNQLCYIELLGGLRIHQSDRVISRFRTQKTASLLAYLACFPKRSHPREELIELLWPETDPEDGRASLRTALSSLRHQLEPPGTPFNSVLVADRVNVRVHPDAVSTDVARFEAAVQSAEQETETGGIIEALTQAINLYHGPLLPGFYEDWALQERERLEQSYIAALGRLPKALEEKGALGEAIVYAQRRVHADPLVDEAHCELIRLHMAAGRPEAARAQYKEMERVFRTELGIRPSSAAQALAERLPGAGRADSRARTPTLQRGDARASASASIAPVSLSTPSPSQPPPPRLPLYLTPFFGREDEMMRLCRWVVGSGDSFRDPATQYPSDLAVRIITLTGAGGSGKTRLAVEAAREIARTFEGRICFVPLADVADAGLILDTLLHTLGLTRTANLGPLEQVAQALGHERTLLVLDNFEQLVETGTPVVWTLLEQIPTLICLVTSRQRLDIEGEQELPVLPLPIPMAPGTPERLVEFPSVRLFVARAQAARPDFQITPDNAAAIVALCEQLEGIPLAIELAVAWAAVLTPSQMLSRLEERFAFLASRRKGIHARHRSLRDTIEWSYRLLPPALQRLFAQLSVFRGGWSLDAAAAVCKIESPDEGEPETGAILEQLRQLQERSLLRTEEAGGDMRFRLLETLREYGTERRIEAGDDLSVRVRHRDFYLTLAEAARPKIHGVEQASTLAMLEREHDNLREALRFCAESAGLRAGSVTFHDEHAALDDSGEAGLRLAIALSPFWEVRGYLSEGRRWLTELLAASAGTAVKLRAKAIESAGTLAWQQADYAAARPYYQDSLALSRQSDDRQGIADALHGLGVISEEQADYDAARAYLEESLAIKRELGDQRGLAASLNTLGNAVSGHGDYDAARALYRESLALRRELDDKRGIYTVLNNLAILAYQQGDYAESRSLLLETLANRRELGDRRSIAICLNNLGELAWRDGDYAGARALNEEGLAIRRELGDRYGVASSLLQLANIAASQQDYASARSLYAESLAIFRDLEDKGAVVECLEKTAVLMATLGESARAARLFGAAESLREFIRAPQPPIEKAAYEGTMASLRSRLPEGLFEDAWQEGRAMPMHRAIEYALEGTPYA